MSAENNKNEKIRNMTVEERSEYFKEMSLKAQTEEARAKAKATKKKRRETRETTKLMLDLTLSAKKAVDLDNIKSIAELVNADGVLTENQTLRTAILATLTSIMLYSNDEKAKIQAAMKLIELAGEVQPTKTEISLKKQTDNLNSLINSFNIVCDEDEDVENEDGDE